MITGIGIIGKFVELIGSKLLGRTIDLSFDRRQRVCRALTELYFCVERLGELADDVVRAIARSAEINNPEWTVSVILNTAPSMDSVTQRLYDLGDELYWVLNIFDKHLATAVDDLYLSKFSLLNFLRRSIKVPQHSPEHSSKSVCFFKPSDEVLSLDFESYYQWMRENHAKLEEKYCSVICPAEKFFGDLGKLFIEERINVTDMTSWENLSKIIQNHAVVLENARELLRKFLASNFRVDEVLYSKKRSMIKEPVESRGSVPPFCEIRLKWERNPRKKS